MARGTRRQQWDALPQEVRVMVSQYLGPAAAALLAGSGRDSRSVALSEPLWRFFCQSRWQQSANVSAYKSMRDLYRDGNGWFPRLGDQSLPPSFDVRSMELGKSVAMTMDLRMTEDEIIAVSTATHQNSRRCAHAHIIDPSTLATRETIEVADAAINCCDLGPGLLFLGADDGRVRIYRRGSDGEALYRAAGEHLCAGQVNDLRLAREGSLVAVRTLADRQPAGLEILSPERPGQPTSFPGGGVAMRGRFVHAIDGFEEGCSLGGIACTGEDPLTGTYSAMLCDFRRPMPIVADVPFTHERQGYPVHLRLWPFRAGRDRKVYANLWHEEVWHRQGTVAMADFRYASSEACVRFHFPLPVDDFRCREDAVYAVCSEPLAGAYPTKLSVQRCTPGRPSAADCLCTLLEPPEADQQEPDERLMVFSLCQRGFALSHGRHLSTGCVVDPWR